MSLPFLALEGLPYDQGCAHGRALRTQIAANLAIYFERFTLEAHLSRDEVLSRARRYRDAIAVASPAYLAAMRGVADGCGLPVDEIVALNVRYEILYHQFGHLGLAPRADGCSAFAILPPASVGGHLVVGQNWDWIPEVHAAVVLTTEPDGTRTLAFTEAGIVGGKIGLNSAGVGLAVNGLLTTDDDWARLSKPFHVRCYEILRSPSLAAARATVEAADRACSANFVIAQHGQAVDIEAAPLACRRLDPRDDVVIHTNHFLDPSALAVVEPPSERRPHSYTRQHRLATLLQDRPITRETLFAVLADHADHPYGICRHLDLDEPPEERYVTVTSVIMDLHDLTLEATDGPPCQAPYASWQLPHMP